MKREVVTAASLIAATAGVFALAGCQSIMASLLLPQEGVRKATYPVAVERSVPMRTRDGVRLVADLYHPVTDEKVPTIMVRIPFTNTIVNRFRADLTARYWATRGYHVVIHGTRGRYKSDGVYYPMRYDRNDGIDTLKWLAAQSWFDGRLGMWGGSAFGYTAWVLSDQLDPGPSALMIQICSTSMYGMFYPGGAFSLESALYWAARSYGDQDHSVSLGDLERGFDGIPLLEADDRAVGDVPFFNDWAMHPEDDGYWREIDGIDRIADLKAPVLLTAGWFDPFLPSQVDDFRRIRQDTDPRVAAASRLVIGPWAHATEVAFPDGYQPESYRKAALAPSIEWFDRHLGHGNANQSAPAPVEIFVMGDNVWRAEQNWPLARTVYTSYYLQSRGRANSAMGDGRLEHNPSSDSDPPDVYLYDPRNPVKSAGGAMLGPRAGVKRQNEIESRKDVLVYTGEPLQKDLEVTGPLSVILYVTTTASNTDFTAKLVDVHPDGAAYNVSDGIVRRAFPEGDGRLSNPAEITINLWPTSFVFKQWHRLRLEVSSSNYPRYDRNPNTGRAIATERDLVSARQRVWHAPDHPSRLVLPVIPRD